MCNFIFSSGETGFARMNESVGYAINPMLERMGGCGFLFTTFAYVALSRGAGLFALRQPAPHELQMLTQTRKPSWSVLVADWSTWVRISTHRLVYIDLTLPDLVFNPKCPLFVWTVAMLAFEAGTKADFFCTGTHFFVLGHTDPCRDCFSLSHAAALSPDVPVTFIYGAESWMESSSGYEVQELLSNHRVEVHVSWKSFLKFSFDISLDIEPVLFNLFHLATHFNCKLFLRLTMRHCGGTTTIKLRYCGGTTIKKTV